MEFNGDATKTLNWILAARKATEAQYTCQGLED